MRKLPSSTQTLSVVSTPQKKCSTFATSTASNRPISVINATGSCSSSISSMTTSPSSQVTTLNRIIDEQSKKSEWKDTDDLKILRRLAEVEKQREELLSLVKKNENLRSLLTNNNVMLEDYTVAKSLPSNLEPSRESTETCLPRTQAKRKRSKGAVASIVETLEGKNDIQAQAKVLKQVLKHKSIRPILKQAGYVDSESREYVTMRNMIGNVGNFIGRAMETDKSQGRPNDDKRSAV